EYVKIYDAKGLAWLKLTANDMSGPIAKFLSDEEKQAIAERSQAEEGDLLLFVADQTPVVYDSLGALRLKLGKELDLIDETVFNFLWVTDWPLLEYMQMLTGTWLHIIHSHYRPYLTLMSFQQILDMFVRTLMISSLMGMNSVVDHCVSISVNSKK